MCNVLIKWIHIVVMERACVFVCLCVPADVRGVGAVVSQRLEREALGEYGAHTMGASELDQYEISRRPGDTWSSDNHTFHSGHQVHPFPQYKKGSWLTFSFIYFL